MTELVLIYGHVQHPMQAVLHAPMLTCELTEALGRQGCAEQIVGRFGAGPGGNLADARDPASRRQPGPLLLLLLLLQPGDLLP